MAIQATRIRTEDQEIARLEAWLNDYIPNKLLPAIAYRIAFIQAIRESGYDSLLSADLLAAHETADREGLALLANLDALGQKTITIVPYQLAGDPALYLCTIPVDRIPSDLSGWFLIARLVLKFASAAAVAAAGVWIANLIGKCTATYLETERLKAKTASDLAASAQALATTDPSKAAEISRIAVEAGQAAENAAANSGSILQRFLGGAAAGAGTILPILILLFFAFRKPARD
jgi:hypothetical protein